MNRLTRTPSARAFVDQRPQALGIRRKLPAMVARELPLAIGHEGGLVRAQLTHEVHQVVEGIALDVELHTEMAGQQLVQVVHVMGADVPRVGPRMHGDALRTGGQTERGSADHAGNAQVAGVAHQGDLVQVDRQGSFFGHGFRCGRSVAGYSDKVQW